MLLAQKRELAECQGRHVAQGVPEVVNLLLGQVITVSSVTQKIVHPHVRGVEPAKRIDLLTTQAFGIRVDRTCLTRKGGHRVADKPLKAHAPLVEGTGLVSEGSANLPR